MCGTNMVQVLFLESDHNGNGVSVSVKYSSVVRRMLTSCFEVHTTHPLPNIRNLGQPPTLIVLHVIDLVDQASGSPHSDRRGFPLMYPG